LLLVGTWSVPPSMHRRAVAFGWDLVRAAPHASSCDCFGLGPGPCRPQCIVVRLLLVGTWSVPPEMHRRAVALGSDSVRAAPNASSWGSIDAVDSMPLDDLRRRTHRMPQTSITLPPRTTPPNESIPEGDVYHSPGLPQRSAGLPWVHHPTRGSFLKGMSISPRVTYRTGIHFAPGDQRASSPAFPR